MDLLQEPHQALNATIVKQHNTTYTLKHEEETMEAKKAFSCLIQPQGGDKVSCIVSDNTYYITHILERKSDTLSIEHKGTLQIKTDELAITSNHLSSHIGSIKSYFKRVCLSGMEMLLKTSQLKTISAISDHTHIQVHNQFDRIETTVNEYEETHTKNSRHFTKENRIVKANNIIETANDQIKMDAQTIHLT